jgi:hypothetical protein
MLLRESRRPIMAPELEISNSYAASLIGMTSRSSRSASISSATSRYATEGFSQL